ncbi:hypothetical protein OAN21_02630 [Alphaproteobacteria bacterium]|nr:hypothetical protein [Alphaproteobacteria bacterium]
MFFFLGRVLTLFFFLSFSVCQADTITLQPVGEYAEIETHKDFSAIEILRGPESEEKRSLAEKIHQNPGDYAPFSLLFLGIYYLEKGNLSQALHYMRAGIFRAVVDVQAAKDSSLENILPTMFRLMNEALVPYFQKNPDKRKQALEILVEISGTLMDWDSKTPRNYDVRWPCLHSIRATTAFALMGIASKPTYAKTGYATKEEYRKVLEENRNLFLKATREDIPSVQDQSKKL